MDQKPEAPPTCTNCQRNHTNYSKCPALLAYLAKRNSYKNQQLPNTYSPHQLAPQAYPSLPNTAKTESKTPSPINTPDTRNRLHSYANALTRQTLPQEYSSINTNLNSPIENALVEVKHSDLDIFFRILELIQKYYTKCTSNIERVRATMFIVKELEVGY